MLVAARARLVYIQAADEMVVTIGHVAPLTGNISHLGKDNENGARLALEDYNAKGMVIGGKQVRFELLCEDDQADHKSATSLPNGWWTRESRVWSVI